MAEAIRQIDISTICPALLRDTAAVEAATQQYTGIIFLMSYTPGYESKMYCVVGRNNVKAFADDGQVLCQGCSKLPGRFMR